MWLKRVIINLINIDDEEETNNEASSDVDRLIKGLEP